MISGHSSISSNFFSLLTRNVLFHPLPGGVRYRTSGRRSWISTRPLSAAAVTIRNPSASSPRSNGVLPIAHEDWLTIFTVDEIGLLLVSFTLPFKPAISKADRPTVLPKRFKHPAAGCGLNPGINQWRFIPPPWCVTPVNRIELQLFVAFAQK